MNSHFKDHLSHAFFGLLMGAVLGFAGFADFSEVHRMFTFADERLLMGFAGAVGLSMVGFAILTRGQIINKKPFTKGTVPGGVLFGIGWAITGACPSIALVQIGQGQLAALVTLFGIFSGVWIYRRMTAGAFQFDTGVCGEE